jgi:hypothetical protein
MGGLRLAPWYSLRDVTYNNNVFGESEDPTSDFTATLGAGLRGYLPVGRKAYLASHALPEYVWWADLRDRRAWNGRYGAGLFTYFNRLALDASATYADRQTYVSSELQTPVQTSRMQGRATVEVALGDWLAAFAGGSSDRWRYDGASDGPATAHVVLLDRNETLLTGGLRLRFENGPRIGLGVQHSIVDFQRPERDRANSGTSPLLEVELHRTRLFFDLLAVYRRLEPQTGSYFVPFQGLTGRARLAWQPGTRFVYEAYARRDLVYSVREVDRAPYYDADVVGVAVGVPIGWRLQLRVFAELGRDRYAMLDPETEALRDDSTGFGGTLRVKLVKDLVLTLGVSQSRWESNRLGGDRDVLRIQTSLGKEGSGSPWY